MAYTPAAPPLNVVGIEETVICIIDFEASCTLPGGRALPCEIGISVGTIKKGEMHCFHRFIDPGPLPIGSLRNAVWNTQHIHSIPHSDFELFEVDYKRLWKDILEFLLSIQSSNTGDKIVLYAKGTKMEKTCIQWLAKKAGVKNVLEVREAEELVYTLYRSKGLQTTGDLGRRSFSQMSNISPMCEGCEYHSTLEDDSFKGSHYHCALSDTRAVFKCIQMAAKELGFEAQDFESGEALPKDGEQPGREDQIDWSFMQRDNWGKDAWQDEEQNFEDGLG